MRSIWLVLALSLAPLQSAHAGIRPSFYLEYSAWHATDIVEVRTTADEAVFEVVESWKGDLSAGERVTVPELTPRKDAIAIAAYPRILMPWDATGPSLQLPRQPRGSPMILFLCRRPGWPPLWDQASSSGGFKTSVVWIERGQAYAFQQLGNPGPSILSAVGFSLAALKDRTVQVRNTQQEFQDVAQLPDGYLKAIRLRAFFDSDILPASQFALAELGKCGPATAPAIRAMLDDPALDSWAADIVKAYAAAGGESAAADLTDRLQREVSFWTATGPGLVQGWWSESPIRDDLRNRYTRTLQLVLALQKTHRSGALVAATQLRDLWRSLPQRNDRQGLDQMIAECDKLISSLQPN